MKKQKIFLSYAPDDAAFAKSLGKRLVREGVEVFDGTASLQPGEDAFDAIREEIRSSDLVVFIVPLREGEGVSALAELGVARAMNKRIAGVLASKARYANSDVARVLSKGLMVDAERLTPARLAETIIACIPHELSAA